MENETIVKYTVWFNSAGIGSYLTGVLFDSIDDAMRLVASMPAYYEEQGRAAKAEKERKSKFRIVPVSVPIPDEFTNTVLEAEQAVI